MRFLLLPLALLLSSCGIAYISPSVENQAAGNIPVNVVNMTPQVIAEENRAPYTPKPLPNAFYQAAGAAGMPASAANVPQPAYQAETRPADVPARLPPQPPVMPYKIGVGDVVLLATKDSASTQSTVGQLTGLLAAQSKRQGYTVQDDGAIAIPDVGRVKIAGLTLQQAENTLFQAIVAKQMDPTFSLEIAEFHSQKVSVGGAVRTPGVAPITLTPLYLDEAMADVGGVTVTDQQFAIVRIYRGGKLYQVPLKDVYASGSNARIRLIDGDSVFVDTEFDLEKAQAYFAEQIQASQLKVQARAQALAELTAQTNIAQTRLAAVRSNFKDRMELGAERPDFVYLTGEVSKQSRFQMPYGSKAYLADALYSEGGFSNVTGNPRQIYLIRGIADGPILRSVTVLHLDGSNAVNMIMATQLELRPNDMVFIAEQPVTKWGRVVNQLSASLVSTGANKIK